MIQKIKQVTLSAVLLTPMLSLASDRYIGEVFFVAERYCPSGSLLANGQTVPVGNSRSLYYSLFTVIANTYGGSSTSEFALPNLSGLSTVGAGLSSDGQYMIGQQGNNTSFTVAGTACPPHQHKVFKTLEVGDSSASASHASPGGHTLAVSAEKAFSATNACASDMAADTISLSGVSDKNVTGVSVGTPPSISSVNPYLAMTACIAYSGTYPQRSE